MKIYVGIDLHSTNCYFAVVNENGDRLFHKRVVNDKEAILDVLKRIKTYGDISDMAVESTYNWYWIVDLLEDNNYPIQLTNPAKIKQYDGLKVSNDKTDAYFLAELLRLNTLPKCWACPREDRPVRELLRSRSFFVQKRTSMKNSVLLLFARYTGRQMSYQTLAQFNKTEWKQMLNSEELVYRVEQICIQIHSLTRSVQGLEKRASSLLKLKPEFKNLTTVPGIGVILALTIMVETGDIKRFAKSGNYTSYCRCVDSNRLSNGKSKGSNNKKNGNKYLAWAYSEAAVNAKRYSPGANKYWQRKAAKSPKVLAYKSLAAKLSKVCYHIMDKEEVYEEDKIFR